MILSGLHARPSAAVDQQQATDMSRSVLIYSAKDLAHPCFKAKHISSPWY